MDGLSFDRMARLIGRAATRRDGLKAALAALSAAAAGEGSLSASAAPGDREDAGVQGPCTPHDVKANRCRSDSECCTNWCEKKRSPGRNAKDGLGRCRCRSWKDSCRKTSDCCKRGKQQMQCLNGICARPVPTGKACDKQGSVCAEADATCTTYTSGSPKGTYCLRELGSPCTKGTVCRSQACLDGICSTPAAIGERCTPGDACRDGRARCQPYQQGSGGPAGHYCLLDDNRDPDAGPSGCRANGQCSSNRCARLSATGTDGYCAPLTCAVCIPYDGISACDYDLPQSAYWNLARPQSGSDPIPVGVYGGTYVGEQELPDDSWHVFSCGGTPVFSCEGGELIRLDVNSAPAKLVHFEGVVLAGRPEKIMEIWGCDCGGSNEDEWSWLTFRLDRVITNFDYADNRVAEAKLNNYVKLEVIDSKLFLVRINSDSGDNSNYITFVRSLLDGKDKEAGPGIEVRWKGATLTLEDSVVKRYRRWDPGVGILFDNNEISSKLIIKGDTLITQNNNPDDYGDGPEAHKGSGIRFRVSGIDVELPAGKTIFDFVKTNPVPGFGAATSLSNCYDESSGSSAACCATPGGFTSGGSCS